MLRSEGKKKDLKVWRIFVALIMDEWLGKVRKTSNEEKVRDEKISS